MTQGMGQAHHKMTLCKKGKPILRSVHTVSDGSINIYLNFTSQLGGHGGRVVTITPSTSEVRVQFQVLPQVEKLVVAYQQSAVYSTEP